MFDELKRRVDAGLATVISEFGGGPWNWRVLSESDSGPNVFEFKRFDRVVIGKFYDDDLGARCYSVLTMLAQRHFEFLAVPTPIAYDDERRILLTEVAAGVSFERVALEFDPERLVLVGQALRELHESGLDFGPPKSLEDHVCELIRPSPERLSERFRKFSTRVERVLEAIRRFDRETTIRSCAPIHRDFHLRQLFDADTRVVVVDWDLCAQGDPAFDVAYFLTYLDTHFEAERAAVAKQRFLVGYQLPEAMAVRLALYTEFNLLRRSCRRLRLQDPGWENEIDWMMRSLDQGVCP